MKICIKTMAGGNYPIEIDENAPLSALRQAIHEVLGTPVDMQRLIFQGHGLTDNERSLKNYGIKDGLVVHMVVRQANMPPPTPAAPATQHRSTTLTRGNAPAFLLPLEAHRGRSFGGSRPSSHTNLISGTLVISRSSIFEDVSQLTTLIERVVSSVVTPLGNSVAAHVQPQTSDSASSDLSYLITIRGNSDVVLDSGALERMAQLLDGVTRNEHALDILNEYVAEMVDSVVSSSFANEAPTDEQLISLGRWILRLDKVASLQRNEIGSSVCSMALEGEEEQEIHSTRARGPSNDSGTQNSNEASNAPSLEGSNNRAQNDASLSSQSSSHGGGRERCTIRHGTSDQYILILDKLSKQQTAIQLQLRRYHNLLTCRRQFQADEYARRILTVYQEHLRRVIHRLSHMFHLVSDLSIGFLDTIGPHGRRVHPLTAQQHQHTATEVALSLVFVPETGRSRSSASTTRGAAQNTQMNLNEQSDRNAPENPSTHISSVRRRPTRRSLSASGRTESASGTHVPPSSSIIDSGSGISAIIARGAIPVPIHIGPIRVTSNEETEESMQGDVRHPSNVSGVPVMVAAPLFIRNIVPSSSSYTRQSNPTTIRIDSQGSIRSVNPNSITFQPVNRSQNGSAQHTHDSEIVGREEAQRSALDAVMHAANAAMHSSTVAGGAGSSSSNFHIHMDERPTPSGESISWVRRAYGSRDPTNQSPQEASSGLIIGPRYPHGTPIYTTDRCLPCQSRFHNPRPSVHNSREYERFLTEAINAMERKLTSLNSSSDVYRELEQMIQELREPRDGDAAGVSHIVINSRGESVFGNLNQFTSVIKMMIRRALANMADFDPNVARELNGIQGEFDEFNYSLTPYIVPGGRGGIIQVDQIAADVELGSMSEHQGVRPRTGVNQQSTSESSAQNSNAEIRSAGNAVRSSGSRGAIVTSVGIEGMSQMNVMEMMRMLTGIMGSDRNDVTFAQIYREVELAVVIDNGFLNVILSLMFDVMGVVDFLQIVNGDYSCITQNRDRLRQILVERYFRNNEPTAQDATITARNLVLNRSELERLAQSNGVNRYVSVDGLERLDLLETALNVDQISLHRLFDIILDFDHDIADADFAQRVVDTVLFYSRRMITLANHSLGGNPLGYEILFLRYLNQSQERGSHALGWMPRLILDHIQHLLENSTPFTINDMRNELVVAPEGSAGSIVDSGSSRGSITVTTRNFRLSNEGQNQPRTSHSNNNVGGDGTHEVNISNIIRILSGLMNPRGMTLSEVFREIGTPIEIETGFLNVLLCLTLETIGISDLLQIAEEDFSCFVRNRSQLRRVLIDRVFNDNSRPSAEDLDNVANRLALTMNELEGFLSFNDVHRFVDVEGIGRVDIAESVLRIDRSALHQLFCAVLDTSHEMSDSEFSQRLTDVFYFFAQRAVALANLALNGNPHGYEILFLRFMERSTDGNSQQVQNWISQLGLRHLRHMLRDFVTFTASDMRSDLVVVSDEPTDSSETACDAKKEYSADQRKISDGVPGSSSNFGTPMDVQSVVGKSIQQAPSLKVSNAVANQKTDRAKNKSISGDTFELPTEWQSVILADRERMLKMQPQAPFSHAYESSGEACRATLSTENECINGADLAVRTVTDALNEAINYGNSRTTSLSPPSRVNNDNLDSQLANAMKQSFHDSLLRRLSNDRDFMEEQHKFPELKKFIARE